MTPDSPGSAGVVSAADEQAALWRRRHEDLAHDLRNPLTALSMSLEMLGDRATAARDEESRWIVDRALAAVARIEALIERRLSTQDVPAATVTTERLPHAG